MPRATSTPPRVYVRASLTQGERMASECPPRGVSIPGEYPREYPCDERSPIFSRLLSIMRLDYSRCESIRGDFFLGRFRVSRNAGNVLGTSPAGGYTITPSDTLGSSDSQRYSGEYFLFGGEGRHSARIGLVCVLRECARE